MGGMSYTRANEHSLPSQSTNNRLFQRQFFPDNRFTLVLTTKVTTNERKYTHTKTSTKTHKPASVNKTHKSTHVKTKPKSNQQPALNSSSVRTLAFDYVWR